MRKLWWMILGVAAVIVGIGLAPPMRAHAGENPIGAGCHIQSINPAVGSSASDSDCDWKGGQWVALQCDVPVYYRSDNGTPTTASPKVTFPGDPYPIHAQDSETGTPLKVLAVVGTAECEVFKHDDP